MTRIFVDMDGTLTEFRTGQTMKNLLRPNYFFSLSSQKNVVEAIKGLHRFHYQDIFILSAALNDTARREKNKWLDRYLPEIDSAHRLFPKNGMPKSTAVPEEIHANDVLLDDYSRNLHEWAAAGGIGIKLMNRINGTHGTWQRSADNRKLAFVDAAKSPKAIAENLVAFAFHHREIVSLPGCAADFYRLAGGVMRDDTDKIEVPLNSSGVFRKTADSFLRSCSCYPCGTYVSGCSPVMRYFHFHSQGEYDAHISEEKREQWAAELYSGTHGPVQRRGNCEEERIYNRLNDLILETGNRPATLTSHSGEVTVAMPVESEDYLKDEDFPFARMLVARSSASRCKVISEPAALSDKLSAAKAQARQENCGRTTQKGWISAAREVALE